MGKIDEILENATEIDVGESWFRDFIMPNEVNGIYEFYLWQQDIPFEFSSLSFESSIYQRRHA